MQFVCLPHLARNDQLSKFGLLVLCRLIEIGFEKMVVAMDAKEAAAMVRHWLLMSE
jgi:hypothetical protein